MSIDDFFQIGPPPLSALEGHYDWHLVALSYFIACLASFVALDIAERIQTMEKVTRGRRGWLVLVGALAMGMGIWTMHFIGMLAFIMPMTMSYDFTLTALSLLIAIIASAFAFLLIHNDKVKLFIVILGGIFLGLAIILMHYVGMAAMLHVSIHYFPALFFLSIIIAITASEAALFLMVKSSLSAVKCSPLLTKVGSALLMGFAICGMHYTGMQAAVFVEDPSSSHISAISLNMGQFPFYVAATTIAIMFIALIASRFSLYNLQLKNKKLLEAEIVLEQKSLELQKLNKELSALVDSSKDREERIQAILAAAGDGIIVLNENGFINVCNRAASEMFGYPIEDMLSKNISHFIGSSLAQEHGATENLTLPAAAHLSFLDKEEELSEFVGYFRGTRVFPIELHISRSEIKNNIVYILICRDITERKRAEQQLKALNYQLVTTARLAGMAEVATGVLHNVGNVLTSINVSAELLLEKNFNSQIEALKEIAKRLRTQERKEAEELSSQFYLLEILPDYLEEFARYLKRETQDIHKELEFLRSKVLHVKNIIAMQQSIQKGSHVLENLNLTQLIDEALAINSELIEKHHIIVERRYEKVPFLLVDKAKIVHVFINLIKNAIEALLESEIKDKKLTLKIQKIPESDFIQVEVMDNGIGIKDGDTTRIFSYGFTTKKKGHGFGLHTSAISIQEMGGTIEVQSLGPQKGANFILKFPLINTLATKPLKRP